MFIKYLISSKFFNIFVGPAVFKGHLLYFSLLLYKLIIYLMLNRFDLARCKGGLSSPNLAIYSKQ